MNKKRIISFITALLIIASMVTFAFATGETAPADAATAEGEAYWYTGLLTSPIPMMVIMFALLYFVLIRPENKRKKETAKMRDGLKVGDEITTIGGIVGKISNVKDEKITIETGADKCKICIMKWAVSSVSTKEKAE